MKKEERLERVQELTDSYKAFMELLSKGSVALTKKRYRAIFAPWHKAAKDLYLVVRKGWTYTANNRFRFPFIPLPESITFLSKDLGGSIWFPVGQIVIVHIRYYEDSSEPYIVAPVDTIRSDQWEYLRTHSLFQKAFLNIKWPSKVSAELQVRESENCLSEDCLIKLFQAYWYHLSHSLALLTEVPLFSLSSWTDFYGAKALTYHIGIDTDLFFQPESPLDIFERSTLWQSDLFRILFAATIFSISKPILRAAGLPVEFILDLKQQNGSDEDFIGYVHIWFSLLCKVDSIKDNPIDVIYRSATSEFADIKGIEDVSPISHHSFPYLYSYKIISYVLEGEIDYNDEDNESTVYEYREPGKNRRRNIMNLSAKAIDKLCTLRNLPIVLSTSEVKHTYPDEKCLSISVIVDAQTRDSRFHNEKVRNDILDLYSGFLRYLSEQNEQNDERKDKTKSRKEFVAKKVKWNARKLYQTSIAQLGLSRHEMPNSQQQHTACILTALALLRQYIEETFPNQNLSGTNGSILHIEQRLQRMAGVRTAGIAVFAAFLKNIADSKDNSLIFTYDDEYLYLHYKEYWPAFEAYCKKYDVTIQYSAAKFRRDILAPDFLKAQYQPTNGKYPRFDYRKKVDGKEATVIAISKRIISEYTPNEGKKPPKHT